MPSALIIGGSGQIGRAVAARLLADGWTVTCGQRTASNALPPGAAAVSLDRSDPESFKAALAPGFDAVIDTIAFDEGHARQLLGVEGDIGALVVISSGSVYRDSGGRSLDEAAETGFPQLPVPIPEGQPTVGPGPATYSTRKVALEQTLLQQASLPVTILRPFAIHGEGSGHAREWWFVKRILDGRRRIPLAYGGESRFQTTSTANIADLTTRALASTETQVLNVADADALTVAQIGTVIARHYGVTLDLVPLDGPPRKGVGGTPWSVAGPIVPDLSRARTLGHQPLTYAASVAPALRSAEARAAAGLPFMDYLTGMFDYAAEDAILAGA